MTWRLRHFSLLIVGFVVAAAITFVLVPPVASTVESPKPACSLLSKSDASKILKSTVREEGGQGSTCKFRGSKSSELVVSDVPNTKKWRSATKNAVSFDIAGSRHEVSIDGARGYYEPKRLDATGPIGTVFYVTYHGYFMGLGVVGVSNTRLAAQGALIKVLKKL